MIAGKKIKFATRLNRMKAFRYLGFLFMIVLVFGVFSKSSNAVSGKRLMISVSMNDIYIKMDASPYQKDNRVYIPLRSICDAAGMSISWFKEEGRAVIISRDKKVELFTRPDSRNKAVIQGVKHLMDTPLEIVEERTMVPVRFVAENLGFKVDWDGVNFDIKLYKEDTSVAETAILERPYTNEDLIWLSRIVAVETDEVQFENKLAVANVVLNRVKSSEYPSTVYGVIFDTKWCVQFPPAFRKGFKELMPSADNRIAAKMALEGVNNVPGCTQFNDYPFRGAGVSLYKKIGGQYFYQ